MFEFAIVIGIFLLAELVVAVSSLGVTRQASPTPVSEAVQPSPQEVEPEFLTLERAQAEGRMKEYEKRSRKTERYFRKIRRQKKYGPTVAAVSKWFWIGFFVLSGILLIVREANFLF